MKFYGIQKITLIDYPGEVASTLFTAGCNFRCGYCHNPELVVRDELLNPIDFEEIFDFFKKRKHVLGGVCITGGEPLLYEEIFEVVDRIRSTGLKVKLDTNGSFPERLKKINVDFIAMDIKTSLDNYKLVSAVNGIEKSIMESIDYIIGSGIKHEFRTTVVPEIVDLEDIKSIAGLLKGASEYVLAQFSNKIVLDESFKNVQPYPFETLVEMQKAVKSAGINCRIRGNF